MVDEIAAIKLKNYILSCYDDNDDGYFFLDSGDIRHFARGYVYGNYPDKTIWDFFPLFTLDYVLILLQELKDNRTKMNEFMLEAYYRHEERDRDSLTYYGDSESNMIDEMIQDSNQATIGDLDEDEGLESNIYHDYREDMPDTDLFDNDCFMY